MTPFRSDLPYHRDAEQRGGVYLYSAPVLLGAAPAPTAAASRAPGQAAANLPAGRCARTFCDSPATDGAYCEPHAEWARDVLASWGWER